MTTATGASTTIAPIPKTPTEISGLDDVLLGGLPRGRTTLVVGGPGTGKTILGLEFLYRGALAGEPGLFITFEESADAVRRNAAALGWDLPELEESGKLFIMQADVPTDLVLSGEFDITGLLAILAGQAQAMGAQRLVIDAVDGLLRLFHDRLRQQNQLYVLHRWLQEQASTATAILTAKPSNGVADAYNILDHLVDCVLRLDQRVTGQVATRRLRVLKYRGSDFLSNEYPYVIAPLGIELIPISSAQLQQQALGPPISTGNSQLDLLLDGGFRRVACVLIAGASGTGKTTLACTFATAAGARNERVLYISFEESREALVNTMLRAGIDLRPALAAGNLQFLTALPESLGVEEHLLQILRVLDSFQPDHLILESLSACHRMGSEQAAFDFIVRLIDSCKRRGITSLFTNQIRPSPSVPAPDLAQISGSGVASLMDALLLLEQRWNQNAYERRLLIIKSRGSHHSHRFHAFTISDAGITIDAAPATAPDMPEEASS